MIHPEPSNSTAPTISKRQRKLLSRWHRSKRLIKVREVTELMQLGLIVYYRGPLPGGGCGAFPVLSEAGRAVLGLEGKN